uniref:Big_5 domain-containing protein n=1 Tax=Steinernema glaseri TaxID=37863 RepID=A0A1I7Z2N3_9BILA
MLRRTTVAAVLGLLVLPLACASQQIQVQLPFFLFANDDVSVAKFDSADPPCLFVVSTADTTKVDLSAITFQFNGPDTTSPESANVQDILKGSKFGVKCFSGAGKYLYINTTGAFKDDATKTAQGREILFYFMSAAKRTNTGVCSDGYWGGNVYSTLEESVAASVAADCPAVFLTTSDCPKALLDVVRTKVPSSGLTVSTPQWGSKAGTELFTISPNNLNTHDGEELVRSVLIISTSEKTPVEGVVKVTADTTTATCDLSRTVKGNEASSGVIASDPLASGDFTFTLTVTKIGTDPRPQLKFTKVSQGEKSTLTVTIKSDAGVNTLSNFHTIVVPNVCSVTVTYVPDAACAPDSCDPLKIAYEVTPFSATTTTVATTTDPTTTSPTSTQSTSSEEIAYEVTPFSATTPTIATTTTDPTTTSPTTTQSTSSEKVTTTTVHTTTGSSSQAVLSVAALLASAALFA